MTTVNDILKYIESIAPRHMAESWDNVGLLCGSRNQTVTKILVALDPFEGVCREARDIGAELIVTHHPLIFMPAKSVTDDTSIGRSIMMLCREGISAINAHTNLDQTPGGVNDVLARTLGLADIQMVNPVAAEPAYGLLRMGTVPEQSLDQFLSTVKQNLKCGGLRYVSGGKPVRKVAVGGGACSGGMMEVLDAGCDTFVASDIKYNQFWDAHDLGLNLIDAGHFHTENPIVPVLGEKLQAAFPDVQVKISETHWDCMKYY